LTTTASDTAAAPAGDHLRDLVHAQPRPGADLPVAEPHRCTEQRHECDGRAAVERHQRDPRGDVGPLRARDAVHRRDGRCTADGETGRDQQSEPRGHADQPAEGQRPDERDEHGGDDGGDRPRTEAADRAQAQLQAQENDTPSQTGPRRPPQAVPCGSGECDADQHAQDDGDGEGAQHRDDRVHADRRRGTDRRHGHARDQTPEPAGTGPDSGRAGGREDGGHPTTVAVAPVRG
jgi:hypothetical protein